MIKTKGQEHREKIRKRFFLGEDAWTGENEKGWFYAPRTLPLLLNLIASKKVSGNCDPSKVYLELWARHMGSGVIEMRHEGDHAFAGPVEEGIELDQAARAIDRRIGRGGALP